MFDFPHHAANSEFETLGATVRVVLDGLTVKWRSAKAPANVGKDRLAFAPAGKFPGGNTHKGRSFTPGGGVNRGSARSRE